MNQTKLIMHRHLTNVTLFIPSYGDSIKSMFIRLAKLSLGGRGTHPPVGSMIGAYSASLVCAAHEAPILGAPLACRARSVVTERSRINF